MAEEFTAEELKNIEEHMKQVAAASGAKVEEEPDQEEQDGELILQQGPPNDDGEPEEDVVSDDDSDHGEYMSMDEHIAMAEQDGWTDEETFRADPKNKGKEWIPADEFNRRKPLIEKIKRANRNSKKQQEQIEDLMARIEKLETGSEDPKSRDEVDRLAELKQERRQAIKSGDDDALDLIDEEIASLEQGAQREPGMQQIPQETQEWIDKNQWFLRSEEMRTRAIELDAKYSDDYPDAGNAEILEMVEKDIRREFAHKFGKRPGGRSATGQGGGSRPASPGVGKSYHDLPADARKQCDWQVKKGWITQEQYVKDYFGDN